MRDQPIVKSIVSSSVIALLALFSTTSCLNTSDEDYTGSLSGSGSLDLDRFPINSSINPDTDDWDDDDDDDDTDIGYYCSIFRDCVCTTLTNKDYELCVEAVQYWSEDDCYTILAKAYPNCLKY